MANTDVFDKLSIFEEFEKLKQTKPTKVILSEGPKETDITIQKLDELSARVYRYLKDHGIGREDMVNIYLPRGCAVSVCILGVWKAGAAAVVLEEGAPKKRVDFIRRDCDCKLVIDRGAWETILKVEPLSGHESLDLHAAAFAVYTSGTMGNPKGVLHEYGKLAMIERSYYFEGEPIFGGDDTYPVYFPMDFIPIFLASTLSFFNGMKLVFVPNEVRTDPNRMRQFFMEHDVNNAYFPASLFRAVDDWGPSLKKVTTSSESANGIWRDPKTLRVLNGYASSETAAVMAATLLDRPYEIAPIGKALTDLRLFVLDEENRELPVGEAGEFCCEMPYTRGYINLPELNKKTFVDGIYHTGDLAKRDEDGVYYIIGRIRDTVSINGKRVEPAGVEAVIQKVTGISQVAVAGFNGENGAYLAAYYLGDTDIGQDELKEMMKDHVRPYMIPSFFIQLDEFPKTNSGKLDRKALPKPTVMNYLVDYEKPQNEIEEKLCEAMQRVLGLPKIGRNDDFFALGGGSLLAIQLILELGIEGVNVEDIFNGKTPAAIASIYEKKTVLSLGDLDEADQKAKEKAWGLTAEQQMIFDYQSMFPNTTMYNLSGMIRLQGVDAEELARALTLVLEQHPAFMTVLFKGEDGKIMQRYAPEQMRQIRVETTTEEELLQKKDDLVEPFEMLDGHLYRCRVFATGDASYLFYDIHHIIADGFSGNVLEEDMARALSGEPLAKDYYFYNISRLLEETEEWAAAKSYFESRYSNTSWIKNLPHEFESKENPANTIELSQRITEEEYEIARERLGIGKNGLYILAGLLTLAAVTKEKDVMVTWIFNGRSRSEQMNIVGTLYRELPVAIKLRDEMTMAEVITDIRDQIEKGIVYSNYPYVRSILKRPIIDDTVCILYQGDYYSVDNVLDFSTEEVELEEKNRASQNALDIEILDGENMDLALLDYAAGFYSQKTIEDFGNRLTKMAEKIAKDPELKSKTVGEILEQTAI